MSLHRIDRSAIVMEYIDTHKGLSRKNARGGKKAPMFLQAYERSTNGFGSIQSRDF